MNDNRWYDSRLGFIGTLGGAGFLIGAALLAFKAFLDDWVKDTPVHQARISIQQHRPIVLSYELPVYMKDQAVLSFYVQAAATSSEVNVGVDQANVKVSGLKSGDTIKVFAPSSGEFKLEVWRLTSKLGSFEIMATTDNSIGDTVHEPVVSTATDHGDFHVSTVSLAIKNNKGSFVILEK